MALWLLQLVLYTCAFPGCSANARPLQKLPFSRKHALHGPPLFPPSSHHSPLAHLCHPSTIAQHLHRAAFHRNARGYSRVVIIPLPWWGGWRRRRARVQGRCCYSRILVLCCRCSGQQGVGRAEHPSRSISWRHVPIHRTSPNCRNRQSMSLFIHY